MFNLADILAQAQARQGFDQVASQFGMAPQQVKAAMDALLPAFSLGLNKATQSPDSLADLFGLFTTGTNYAQMYDQPLQAGQAMMAAGQQALTRIFGSPELTQAIAQQTAIATGMQQEAMRQVMPMMASLLMGGLMKGATGGQNPLAQMFAAAVAALAPQRAGTDPMAGMMGMFGNAFGSGAPKPGTMPGMEQMMELARQMQAANPLLAAMAPTTPPSETSGPRTLGQQAADTWTATMGRMFEAGREVQDQQLAQLESLFARFGKAPPPQPTDT